MHHTGAQQFALYRGVDGGHAATDHNHAPPHREGRQVGRLAQRGNEVHRVGDTLQCLTADAQFGGAGQTHSKENGVVFVAQHLELRGALQLRVVADLNPANFQ